MSSILKNGAEVMWLLDKLEQTPSTNKKQIIVDDYINDPLFRAVCKWSLDAFITYGVTKWPKPSWNGPNEITVNKDGDFLPSAVQLLLENLSERIWTGNEAQEKIQTTLEMLTPASAELLERILSRSLKCKVTKTIINKACPGMIPTFDVMCAYEYEEKRVKNWPVYVEEKFDGVRLICFVNTQKQTVNFFSRSGIPFTNLNHLHNSMLKLADLVNLEHDARDADTAMEWVFDGEALAGAFNKTVGDIRRQKEQAVDAIFNIFDLVPRFIWDSKSDITENYYNRSCTLFNIMTNQDLPGLALVKSTAVNSYEEIQEEYEKVRNRGGEGLIVKLYEGTYQRKKSVNWLKIKAKETVDLIITGKYEGDEKKKYAGMLGGYLCDFNGVEVRVGGGFSDPEREALWHEDNTGRMIEVEYHEVTPDGSLRHGRFKGFRDDKHLPEE